MARLYSILHTLVELPHLRESARMDVACFIVAATDASAQMVVRVFSQPCLSCSLYAVMPGSVVKSPLQTLHAQVRNLRRRGLHEHTGIPQHSRVALVTSSMQAECASVSSYCHHLQSFVHESKAYLHATCTSSLEAADSSAIDHTEKQTAIDIGRDHPR
jgi:hypothetical protein